MRKLTVTRRKAFAGCLGSVKIYIEDPNGDTDISGVRCRFLGKIRNNASVSFEIDNGSYKLFAIYDKLSKNYCNDYYPIPEGKEDIEVSGAAQFNPFAGNPFQFDGAVNDGVLANRQKNNGKAVIITIIAIVVGFILGFGIMLGIRLLG